jgi:large subunit ribosomal protein LP0
VNLNDVLSAFTKNATNITALSLGTGIVTEASVPHVVLSAFKNLAAIGV